MRSSGTGCDRICIVDRSYDANDGVVAWTAEVELPSHGRFTWKSSVGQESIDDDYAGAVRAVRVPKGASVDERYSHRAEIVAVHLVLACVRRLRSRILRVPDYSI